MTPQVILFIDIGDLGAIKVASDQIRTWIKDLQHLSVTIP